jgi:hypothetical protein
MNGLLTPDAVGALAVALDIEAELLNGRFVHDESLLALEEAVVHWVGADLRAVLAVA